MKAELIHFLSFGGNCREAMNFYQSVLGGELSVTTFRGSEMEAGTPEERLDEVLLAQLRGDGFRLMAADIPSEHHQKPNPMMQLSLNVWTMGAGEQAFAKLSEGGQIFMPFQKTFWAERFGMFADRYGFSWMINYELPGGPPAS